MKDCINDLIKDVENYRKRIHHTYLVYKKLELEKGSNISQELLSQHSNINNIIYNIYKTNLDKAQIIKTFDYGEGFDYKIITIRYKGFVLVFVNVIFELIFVNYFNENEIYPVDETVCLYDIHREVFEDCVHSFSYRGRNFRAINTHNPFIKFCGYINQITGLNKNIYFWDDVTAYLNSSPQVGRYRYIQLGKLFIITDFEQIDEINLIDINSTKIITEV